MSQRRYKGNKRGISQLEHRQSRQQTVLKCQLAADDRVLKWRRNHLVFFDVGIVTAHGSDLGLFVYLSYPNRGEKPTKKEIRRLS